MTLKEAAEIAGCTPQSVNNYVRRGEFRNHSAPGQIITISIADAKLLKKKRQMAKKIRCRGCGKKVPIFRIGRCQPCYRKKERERKQRSYETESFRKYGITIEQYEAMLEAQGGVCAICGESESERPKGKSRRLSVDHDHKTGAVRGLLCSRCNRLLHALDRDGWIKKAKWYLKQHQS